MPIPCLPRLRAVALLLALMPLAGCGFVHPGTPGHEPPGADARYNPVSGEENESGR